MGKDEKPSIVILDSQAVKNTDNASQTGWCHHKCTNGIKRHVLVDVTGIPVSILVTTANVNDRVGGKMLCKQNKELLKGIKQMLVDWGYSGKGFKISIKKTTGITVIIAPKPVLSNSLAK